MFTFQVNFKIKKKIVVMGDEGKNNGSAPALPKQALFIMDLLKESGVTDYEPQVVNQLLEFSHAYITDRLSDAQDYANHAGRANIALEDVKLAVLRKSEEYSTPVLTRDSLLDIAREKNASPLPALKAYSGPRLPPDRYCLSSHNYRLKNELVAKKKPVTFVDPTSMMSKVVKKDFVNPQMIMPTGATKRKWQDEDDYD